jgi:glycosyltransferase involved in cell wall biosynthesis
MIDRLLEGMAGRALNGIPRVCLLAETFHPVLGGSENHARLLAGSLNALGMRSWVLTRRCESCSARSEVVDGIPVIRIPPSAMGRWGKFLVIPGLRRVLWRMRDHYDLVFVCGLRILGPPAVDISTRLGKACVLRAETFGEMSGAYASVYRKLPPVEALALRRWVSHGRSVMRNADGFVAISSAIAEEFASCGMEPSRIHHIPCGIDPKFRPVDADTSLRLREKLGLPVRSRIVTYSGRLVQGKGLEYLLPAWEAVAATHDGVHLVLVGSGHGEPNSIEDNLRRRVGASDLKKSVIFAGWSDQVQEYLQASDVYAFPSEHEGFGLAPVEAMSCGLPVIASRVGAVPDAIRDRESGILLEPRDVDGLARAISELLDHPRLAESLGANALQTARLEYSMDTVAARYFGLFSSICSKRKAA